MALALTLRSIEVLHSIVRSYIETGEPVASRTIARQRKDHLSPATVRNIMAELAEMGYLEQPHTSAGRVPTALAFRHFANSIAMRSPSVADLGHLREELVQHPSLEQRAECASHLLTRITRNVGIVAAVPVSEQCLDSLELVSLPDGRVLMVVITRDGLIRNQVAHLSEAVRPEELSSIRNYVNHNFAGWRLSNIRAELGGRLREEHATADNLLRRLALLYNQGMLSIGLFPQVYLEGASNLLGLDLHLTQEKLRTLFRALEEKKRLIEMLDQFLGRDLGSAAGRVRVQIGLEELHPELEGFALIGISVAAPAGLEARVAVLGPLRMNYARVIAAVNQASEAFLSLPQ